MTSCTQAIKAWETKHEQKAEDAKEINITCQIPPLTKLDNSLSALKCCQKLSMSTNMIDRMAGLGGMSNLRILSMGRNNIKNIEKLDEVTIPSSHSPNWTKSHVFRILKMSYSLVILCMTTYHVKKVGS
mmetsp:Transcript_44506/g.52129  ORF Transcript_44506/g.52129 Transcript_44506/m.52129 type:complete len:129 (+) Transcript_44506:95-481(+)